MLLYFNHLHPSTRSQRPEDPAPPATMQTESLRGQTFLLRRKQKSGHGKGADSMRWGNARWRASPDVPCRHSWRHVLAARPQPHVGAKPAIPGPVGGDAVRSHPRTHAERDSHPRYTRILRIGPVFVGGTDTPIGQPSQLKPLKTKALSSDTGRASPGNHRKYLYMRHSATSCDIS